MNAIDILRSLDSRRRAMPPTIHTWNLTRETHFPKAGTDVRIKLFFLEAPLSMVGTVMNRASFMTPDYVDVNAFHCALGFQYDDAEKTEFATDLIAETFNAMVLLPDIVGNELVWKNKSIITYYSAIDRNYWSKSTFVGMIDGHLMQRLHNWIFSGPGGGYYALNYMYIFFNITQMVNNEPIDLTRRTVCDSFADEAIVMLKRHGAAIEFITPIHTAFTPIFVKDPKTQVSILDPNKPDEYAVIFKFYKTMSEIISILAGKLLAGIPTEQDTTALTLITHDYFSLAKLFAVALGQMMQNSGSIYMIFYSYGNDAKGSPTYYKITNPTIFLNYIVSDITRNIVGSTFHGRKFYDEYTDGYSATGPCPGSKSNRSQSLRKAIESQSLQKAIESQSPRKAIESQSLGSHSSHSSHGPYGSHKSNKNSGSGVGFFYFLFLVLIIILVCWVLGKKY